MNYYYLRVFLIEVDIPPLLIAAGRLEERLPRHEYLKAIFSETIEFDHRSKSMIYKPISVDEVDGGAVCSGRIGAQKTELVNASPEKLFEPEVVTNWLASDFLIDTRSYNDGQKVAMQSRDGVGAPLPVLSSLMQHVNSANPDSGWEMEINQITEKATFWEVVKTYQGQITSAEFRYATPNVLGLRSAINERLKEYKDQENANQVRVTLENSKGGLQLDSQEVRDAVEYTSEGGGSAKLKVGPKNVYDSEDEDKSIIAETEDDVGLEEETPRRGIIERLFKR